MIDSINPMKMMNSIHIPRPLLSILTGILVLSMSLSDICMAQEKERTRMRSYFFIHPDGDRQISVLLTAGRGRDMTNVANAEITFEIDLGDSTLHITDILTNQDGYADLYVEAGYKFPLNEEGFTTILASFAGNDTLRSSDTDQEIKDVFLDMEFDMEDSVKILTVKARQYDAEGLMIPVEELDIKIGVERLYSILPLDEIETDEDGLATYEFPDDIPGDSAGSITVIARVEEHDQFGTATRKASVDWGIPVSYELREMPRQLFTDEAPLWMIIAVFVVLVGAWYHFFLSIFKLNKMRKVIEE